MEEELFSNKSKEEYVLCAAIHFNDRKEYEHQPKNIASGFVVCGRRHHNCFITAKILGFDKKGFNEGDGSLVQGFLTSKDRFLDRKEAAKLAISMNQTDRNPNILFSEDLY